MFHSQIPSRKLGTPFQRPSWRYDAWRNPDNYGFRYFCSKVQDNSKFLYRLINKGISYQVEYKIPSFIRNTARVLPTHLHLQLVKIWEKEWKKQHKYRLSITDIGSYNLISWNIKKIEKLNDVWFKRLIKHIYNIDRSPAIELALNFYKNKDYAQLKRFIGHEIFAGFTDAEISKKWNISKEGVTAIRMLFFDFSCYPKDKVAQWATLVQWSNNGDISADEFSLYKRVYELGALGLKAQVCGYELTEPERVAVSDYLTKSALVNTFNLNFATRTSRDAFTYNKVLMDMATLNIRKAELKLKGEELKLLGLQVKNAESTAESTRAYVMTPEDQQLIQSSINELAIQDKVPQFQSIFDINQIK